MSESRLLHELPGFDTLKALRAALKTSSIEQLLISDENRTTEFSAGAAGLSLDYSKQLLSSEALQALIQLGKDARLADSAAALLAGETLNTTENRPALHSLLRTSSISASAKESLGNKFSEVETCRERIKYWANKLNQGEHVGYTNDVITDIVNIGIGGSDLGPRLVSEALTPYHGPLNCHYIANVDPADLSDTLASLTPATTLFIVCSKTFKTQETLSNALTARQWMLQAGATTGDLNSHFLAATSNLSAATKFGISAEHCLPLWDWVGGRYSVWSAVGLSCAIAVGWTNFEQFLAGANAMDDHFANAPVESNMPMLMSLLEVWNSNFLGASNHVVLPYAQHLLKLPDFLQQLTMESNGKCVTESGMPLEYSSAPVLWGAAGTMGQHSFHQMLHQGTALCPVDFILPLTTHTDRTEEHRMLVANCLAQSRALMVGRSLESAHETLLERGIDEAEAKRLAPHLAMPGNRPSSTITMDSLTPATLGALLALYEHRTFCSGQLWGINSFDQWGVELGKEIGNEVLAELSGESQNPDMDASTAQLIARWRLLQ
jgi:glucose-6-phosphate isomerase